MAEGDIRKRFLNERKRGIQGDVEKVQVEYDAIVKYLSQLLSEARLKSDILLNETDYATFNLRFRASMNSIQDILSKFILIRLSLPDQDDPVDTTETFDVGKKKPLTTLPEPYVPALPKTAADDSYFQDIGNADSTFAHLNNSHNRNVGIPTAAEETHLKDIFNNTSDRQCAVKKSVDLRSRIRPVPNTSQGTKQRCAIAEDMPQVAKLALCDHVVGVTVIEVVSPWIFWVQMRTKDQQMQDISDRLEVHHTRYESNDPRYRFDPSQIRAGALVSAKFSDECWYRARIVTVFKSQGNLVSEVEAFYIDFGNRLKVSVNWLRSLPPDLQNWPAQAFVCAVASICPVNDSNWTLPVTEEFSRLIIDSEQHNNKQLIRLKNNGVASSIDCPLVIVDIYKDGGDFRSASSPTAAHNLVSHGFARPLNDIRIVVNWYLSCCDSLISDTDDVVESMRWIDLHRLQMPEFFLDDTPGSVEDGMSVSSVSCRDFSSHLTASKVKPDAAISNCLKYGAPATGNLYYCGEDLASGPQEMKMNFSRQSLSDNLKKLDEMIASPKIRAFDERPYYRDEPEAAAPKAGRNGDLIKTVSKISAKDRRTGLTDMQQSKMLATQSWVESSLVQIERNGISDQNNDITISKTCSLARDFKAETEPVRDKNVPEGGREMSAGDLDRGTGDTSSHKPSQFSGVADCGTESQSSLTGNVRSGRSMIVSEEHSLSVGPFGPFGDSTEELKISPHEKSQNSMLSRQNKKPECFSELKDDCKAFVTELSNESAGVSKLKAGRKGSAVASKNKGRPINSMRQTNVKENGQGAVLLPTSACGDESNIKDTKDQIPDKRQRVEQHITAGLPPMRLIVPADHRFAVAASVIESPGRFWVHAVNDEVELIDALGVKLLKYAKLVKVSKSVPVELYASCCAPSCIDGLLYRAEIISICYGDISCGLTVESGVIIGSCRCDHVRMRTADEAKSIRAVCVLFVDFGNSEWTKPSDLLPVPEDLLDIPPMAICCQLEALEAITKKTDLVQENQWSKEAVDCFKNLVGYDRLLWAFVGAHLQQGAVISPSMRKPLRVTIMDFSVSISSSINEQLVELGFAKKIDYQPLKSWNPMTEDYFSERNSYQVDVDDPGVATVGYRATDENRICRFFNMSGGCWSGDYCPNEHTRYSDIKTVTNDRKPVFCINELDLMIELPDIGGWILVQVVHIFNPSHVCVVFPYGIQTYSELLECGTQHADIYASDLSKFHDELHDHYSRKTFPDTDLTLFGSGELVVAKFTGNDRWYRARVVGHDSCHNVKVLYIDFGNHEWIAPDRIRQMDAKFLHLPSQAVHCYLPICSAMPNGKWDITTRNVFEELVIGKILAAKIVNSGRDVGSLCIDLYDGDDFNVCEELINMELALPAEDSMSKCVTLSSRLIPG